MIRLPRVLRSGYISALTRLPDALKAEEIPSTGRAGMWEDKIAVYLHESSLPLPRRALSSDPLGVETHQESNLRFVTSTMYDYQNELQELYDRWMDERTKLRPAPLKKSSAPATSRSLA